MGNSFRGKEAVTVSG